jgi:hypothetical protein
MMFHCTPISLSKRRKPERLEGKAQTETERGVAAPVCSQGKKLQLAALGENCRPPARVRPPNHLQDLAWSET